MVLSHSANFVLCSNSDERSLHDLDPVNRGPGLQVQRGWHQEAGGRLGDRKNGPRRPNEWKNVSEKMVMSLKLLVTDRISHWNGYAMGIHTVRIRIHPIERDTRGSVFPPGLIPNWSGSTSRAEVERHFFGGDFGSGEGCLRLWSANFCLGLVRFVRWFLAYEWLCCYRMVI